MTSELISRLTNRLFGTAIITNVVRGEIAEEIIAMALEPEWEHCGGDYASCDLRHRVSSQGIQVKQAAALQTWGSTKSAARFSIVHKTGAWDNKAALWIPGRSRNADIFIFGWHPRTDDETDHRNADQWRFFVVAENALPEQKSIGLTALQKLATPVGHKELKSVVSGLLG